MSATHRPAAPYSGLAPHYDLLVGDAAFDAIWRAFRLACRTYDIRFASAADLVCGTGRFLERLCRNLPYGAPLYGVDLSPHMLAVARRRTPAGRVRLLRQDMRDFSLPERVDLLTCNFDAVNYLRSEADLAAAFSACARNLARGGHLIFDMLRSSCAALGAMVPFRQRIAVGDLRAVWRGAPVADGSVVVIEACKGRRNDQRCWREVHRQRWWPLEAVLRLLRRSGLRQRGVHALPGFSPVDEADRWVQIVAQRC